MATAIPVTAALHCLRTLTTDKYCKDERSADDWRKLLQSALAKVIDLAKTGEDMLLVSSSDISTSVLSFNVACGTVSTSVLLPSFVCHPLRTLLILPTLFYDHLYHPVL